MSDSLSPQSEQFIADALSSGRFATRDAVVEAALLELRAAEGDEDARLALCESALQSIQAGKGIPTSPTYWDEILRRINDGVAAAKSRSGS